MPRFPSRSTILFLISCLTWSGATAVDRRLVADTEPRIRTQAPTIAASRIMGSAESSSSVSSPALRLDVNRGPQPEWIWGRRPAGSNDRFFFRKTFEARAAAARLVASCDNGMEVFLNGRRVARGSEWNSPVNVDVTRALRPGENELLVEGSNAGGPAGLIVKLILQSDDGKLDYIVSDASWTASEDRTGEYRAVTTLGKLGVDPWKNVFANPVAAAPRDVFFLRPGFQVELLYTVPKESQGSWVSICLDDKGRIIASDQGDKGLYRITPAPIGSDAPTQVERLDVKITSAQGMLYAFDSLYLSVNGGPGSGLYRARDTDGDDQFDEVVKLKAFAGGGEHGPHALRLSPDGQSIICIAGNHTRPPADFDASRLPSNWGEDLLLPRQWDARGHARGILAPGGWIAKTDRDGTTWEILSSGYRNPYDMDFNADGELFAYDADMEWDLGTPWYRPTRVVHATSGSEFGWRSGTGKWPTYYVDSLPPVVDIGPGSPVGVTFGYGTRFPAKYQRALFICDWTFGTMYAIHLEPHGASYRGTKEEFLSRTPLPLTDVLVGADGALYFTIGGRGTQSELFRVTYVGDESTEPAELTNSEGGELRALRRELEAFHAFEFPASLDTIWPQLKHPDRFIRYAARVALEAQPVAWWQDRLLRERDAETLITGMVALARQGKPAVLPAALRALGRLDESRLTTFQRLELYRAYELLFIRLGPPDAATAAELAARWDARYPAETNEENRELVQLLVYLNSPTVITKTLALMEKPSEQTTADMAELLARNSGYGGTIAAMLANQPEIEKIHYAFVLRNMRYGWTLPQREQYFQWLNRAMQRSGGASYQGFIQNIRNEALANMSAAERAALESKVPPAPPRATELPKPRGPGHAWTSDEIVLKASALKGRSFEEGKRAFAAARCVLCHRFDGEGGATGPDLSNVAGRFSLRDLAESLTDPSKVISDQYRASNITTKDGKVFTGRIVGEQDDTLTVMVDPEDATKIVEIAKSNIEQVAPSPVSLMPKDLLNVLNEQEVLDLLAFLLSRGNPNDPMFAR